jgi:hypothetical protein
MFLFWSLVCFFRGHVPIAGVVIHKKRQPGMHRGVCHRCGETLWITYKD